MDKNFLSVLAVILAFVIFAPMLTDRSITGQVIQDTGKYCGSQCPNGYEVVTDNCNVCDGLEKPLCKLKSDGTFFGKIRSLTSSKLEGQCTTAGSYGACNKNTDCTFECANLDDVMSCVGVSIEKVGYCACSPKYVPDEEPKGPVNNQKQPSKRAPQFQPGK